MNKIQKQRLQLLTLALFVLIIAAGLLIYAFSDDMNAYLTPTELKHQPNLSKTILLGGFVVPHSLKKTNTDIQFIMSDGHQTISVFFQGIPPDLFREGKGVIATGKLLSNGVFKAETLLAKHDETYTPPMQASP
jgi:cytochrome c-type biogenesis protein CcmE